MIFTFTPDEARRMAEARPPGPAPMMMTSFFIDVIAGGGAGQNFVFTPQARRAHQPRAASNARNADARASPSPDRGRFRPNTTAAMPKTTAPPARKSRPLLSMLETKRYVLNVLFFIGLTSVLRLSARHSADDVAIEAGGIRSGGLTGVGCSGWSEWRTFGNRMGDNVIAVRCVHSLLPPSLTGVSPCPQP